MAKITLFTAEEYEARHTPKRERQVIEWMDLLRTVEPGWAGDVELEEGDEKRKVRLMLQDAASRLSLTLRFRPLKDKQKMQFEVIALDISGNEI